MGEELQHVLHVCICPQQPGPVGTKGRVFEYVWFAASNSSSIPICMDPLDHLARRGANVPSPPTENPKQHAGLGFSSHTVGVSSDADRISHILLHAFGVLFFTVFYLKTRRKRFQREDDYPSFSLPVGLLVGMLVVVVVVVVGTLGFCFKNSFKGTCFVLTEGKWGYSSGARRLKRKSHARRKIKKLSTTLAALRGS
ncbi:hypothetical protein TRVL_02269 [Trypanosoma vivax]|nr:hypothetical protein TRVL_02269 [Trypanosoma vivax]